MRHRSLATLTASMILASAVLAGPALAAADPGRAARDMYGLFSDACVDNVAMPDGVKAWAAKHKLESIKDASAIKAFSGGEEGAVWEVSTNSNPFALALRPGSGACAVFGDKVDVAVVEEQYKSLVEALGKTGRSVRKVTDETAQGDFGAHHSQVYVASGSPSTILVALITNEKPGGLFQATIQISEQVSGRGSSR